MASDAWAFAAAAVAQFARIVAEWRARRADRHETHIIDAVRDAWGCR